ncbi:uncharacterized protein [Palaemon carinicauda]|uniref:uncharacterized protein n=1 Tax=Palaemon carinicauda TaxID=392227 RepID=UPI0035B60F59
MIMLKLMAGIKRLDNVRNDLVRGTTKVTEVSKNNPRKETPLVLARNEERPGVCWEEDVGDVPGRKRRGRPKIRWMECVTADMEEKDLTLEDIRDRRTWKGSSKNSDPA